MAAIAFAPCPQSTSTEVVVALPASAGCLGLSTRGQTAFRIRILPPGAPRMPFDSPMIAPDGADMPFITIAGTGIASKIGTVSVDSHGVLTLYRGPGTNLPLMTSLPIHLDAGGLHNVTLTVPTPQHLFGRGGGASKDGTSKGCEGGPEPAELVTTSRVLPRVENCAAYTPHYWSTAGYAALGAINTTASGSPPSAGSYGGTNVLPVEHTPSADGMSVVWSWQGMHSVEIFLMPAATLDDGTAAYFGLIGSPPVPPLWTFGFTLCRWGWSNRSYLEDTLHRWRAGRYPADAFIMDFGWFTHVSDYAFPPAGFPDYHDFGYHNATLPQPRKQLGSYRSDLHFRFGGIRKPRLGNSELIKDARALGLLLPGGEKETSSSATRGFKAAEGGAGTMKGAATMKGVLTGHLGVELLEERTRSSFYAQRRNFNFSSPHARSWYADHNGHYLDDGVEFFWNDEGETDYFTYYYWNIAQRDALRQRNTTKRFFSINRAFTPGNARLGAAVWTGDIHPTWDALRNTPALVLSWGLAGMPYVACDIGGFVSQTTPLLLTRWYQLGALIPTMRTQ